MLITIVWVIFAVNFFGTIAIRKVKHLYVAIWFYMSFVITIAVLHIVNSLAVPATFTRSYPVYAGLTDALVQWWYGHNAVGFFLTTPFLGLMYYFLPRIAERPVYSYRLSIVHFWALVFLYIWAGPHHLLYSALPGVGPDPGHGVQHHADRALLGRHAERPAHAARAPGTGSAPTRCSSSWWWRSASTA